LKNNIVAIIQARTGSSRLPEKVFKNLEGNPLIYHICQRLKSSQLIDNIVIATTSNPSDDSIESFARQHDISFFRGSEEDVLSRFYFAASEANATIIVRITADDPFKDPTLIDRAIKMLITEKLDFAYNNYPPTFPEGMDVEVFTFIALKAAFENAKDSFEKEHVTQYFYRNLNLFKTKNFSFHKDISEIRLTVDTQNDLKLAQEIYKRLYIPGKIFGLLEILDLYEKDRGLFNINTNELRSAMYRKIK